MFNKKMLLIIALLFSLSTALAQPYLQVGAGYHSLNLPAVELGIGYNIPIAFVQIGYIASIKRDIRTGPIINGRIGKRITLNDTYFLEPSIGYAEVIRSTDRKYLNSSGLIYSFYTGKLINGNAMLVGVNFQGNVWIADFVIRFNFDNHK